MGWTDGIREVEWNRDVLERIVALLLALAGLADRASGLPASRRLHLLCVLAVGEAKARALITGMAFNPSGEAGSTACPQPDDAPRLASRFRALALMLAALLALAGRLASRLRREAGARAVQFIGLRKPAEPQGRVFHHAARAPPLQRALQTRTTCAASPAGELSHVPSRPLTPAASQPLHGRREVDGRCLAPPLLPIGEKVASHREAG